ncbi:1-acyl-sn-glycerol-3-phosphate acyltransferase [Saccharopolyspora antimicrobica]|uniref:1-acyl-sn-glycerol-3-phosphate acyltransferase n=1 Tax=Saccharopolyspora antimicrobica TaxID=455193 RepID=A0A1I4T954_9PSEU|nr:lysophospholipid acyltransferase family protein [Saccharopolyspora antimicrobica]RKT85810.1 1-acyl-sn-glycerol-3-phosphate acyltransferase [Saccharopolyspora antimicrobica]SFM73216.1 1-acyl-sn-glycerol-3-phosphate acyltransferase [Saccharopolyspora antimicrobica]
MAEPKSLRRQRRQSSEKARGMGKFWLGLARAVFYPLTGALARTEVRGLENIPAEGPALLVLNHVSHLDPVFDAVTVHRAARVPRFLAKHTLWNVPVLKSVLVGVEQIPVYRGTADAQKSLREAHQALGRGKTIVIYPDGTITKDPDGWPMTPKVGVARLALAHDIPVIPAARWGTKDVYDHYKKRFRPFPRKTVKFAFGEPLDLSAYRGMEHDGHALREVTHLAMNRVRDLLGEIRGEEPPAEFYSSARKKRGDDGAA